MPQEFGFVNLTGAQIGGEGQKFVRAHVMREYRRKQKNGLLEDRTIIEVNRHRYIEQEEPFVIQNEVLPAVEVPCDPPVPQLTLPPNVSHSDLDPFLTLPQRSLSVAAVSVLMHHCKIFRIQTLLLDVQRLTIWAQDFHVYAGAMFPLDVKGNCNPFRNIWFPFILADPALMQATLCIAAAHYSLVSGKKNELLAAFLRTEAILSINARLGDEVEATSDHTIGAVLSLANSERMGGDLATWDLHMKGLEQMIRLRGGLQSLKTNKIVAKMIFWQVPRKKDDGCFFDMFCRSDVSSSSVLGTVPRFPRLEPDARSSVDLGSESSTFGSGFMTLMLPSKYHDLLAGIGQEMQYVTALLEPYHLGGMSNLDAVATTEAVYRMQHRLLSFSPADGDSESNVVVEASCLGASLFLVSIQPHFITFAPIVTKTRKKLYNLLASSNTNWENSMDLLLWVLFMGGMTTVCRLARPWYTFALRELASKRNFGSYEDVKAVLRKFVWLECICDDLCKTLWDEVTFQTV